MSNPEWRQHGRRVSMTDTHNTIRLSDTPRGLRAAAAMLRQGETVAFPTETVYGLGADATNPRAVAAIYAAKGRPSFNPLIVHVPDLETAERIAQFNSDARALAAAFWPGPLTLVLPVKPDAGIADLVTAGLDTIALRVPANRTAQALLNEVGVPLAAPSANPSGRVTATTADHVMESLGGRVAGVVDGGACTVGVESTIIGLTGDTAVLLRPGGLPVEIIEDALGQECRRGAGKSITAPGQLESHYAPGVSLVTDATVADAGALWLAFGPLGGRKGITLSESGDLTEAAARLFGALHDIDDLAAETGIDRVLVDPIPDHGLGLAINDRLRRAAAPRP